MVSVSSNTLNYVCVIDVFQIRCSGLRLPTSDGQNQFLVSIDKQHFLGKDNSASKARERATIKGLLKTKYSFRKLPSELQKHVHSTVEQQVKSSSVPDSEKQKLKSSDMPDSERHSYSVAGRKSSMKAVPANSESTPSGKQNPTRSRSQVWLESCLKRPRSASTAPSTSSLSPVSPKRAKLHRMFSSPLETNSSPKTTSPNVTPSKPISVTGQHKAKPQVTRPTSLASGNLENLGSVTESPIPISTLSPTSPKLRITSVTSLAIGYSDDIQSPVESPIPISSISSASPNRATSPTGLSSAPSEDTATSVSSTMTVTGQDKPKLPTTSPEAPASAKSEDLESALEPPTIPVCETMSVNGQYMLSAAGDPVVRKNAWDLVELLSEQNEVRIVDIVRAP